MTAIARIGDSLSRVDGRLKVTGQARYAAEHAAEGLLHGWVVSSAIAKGRIVAIREAAARAVPGVVEVITHANRAETAWLLPVSTSTVRIRCKSRWLAWRSWVRSLPA